MDVNAEALMPLSPTPAETIAAGSAAQIKQLVDQLASTRVAMHREREAMQRAVQTRDVRLNETNENLIQAIGRVRELEAKEDQVHEQVRIRTEMWLNMIRDLDKFYTALEGKIATLDGPSHDNDCAAAVRVELQRVLADLRTQVYAGNKAVDDIPF